MAKPIDQVAVLGAGVMGASIAAHLANAGIKVLLLDIPPKDAPAAGPAENVRKARNKITADGLDRARKAKPAAFLSPRFDALVTVGNLEDDLAAAAASDFIIEAVIENLEVKRALYTRLDALGGQAVVASNTSGLRMKELLEGRSADFKRRFCITHFFNPPRYLKLLEIVAGPDTAPETIAAAEDLCGRVLGKGLVRAKDTPNFIANRVGTFAMLRALDIAVKEGYTVEEVDMVLGPATGRPKSAVFRTADVVGHRHLRARGPELPRGADQRRAPGRVRRHPVLEELVKRKWLGSKSGQGFYKKAGRRDPAAGPQDVRVRAAEQGPVPVARRHQGRGGRARAAAAVVAGDDKAAAFAGRCFTRRWPTRRPAAGDRRRRGRHRPRHALGLRLGPRALRDLGRARREGHGREDAGAGIKVPEWVQERLAAGEERFYGKDGPTRTVAAAAGRAATPTCPADSRVISLEALRAAGKEVERNASASLLDIGDGVFCWSSTRR